MRVSHRPTLNSNYKEFCRVNFELLRVLYRPNLNSFTSFRIIESSADKTSNYCVFKISLSSAVSSKYRVYQNALKNFEIARVFKGPAFSFELPRVLNYRMFELSRVGCTRHPDHQIIRRWSFAHGMDDAESLSGQSKFP
ncbi:hypothetical protein J6590_014999 [Homalodisca vitripennis]|nr:hypothetical protein J6590_014999 [Homalodisca vitripennis]